MVGVVAGNLVGTRVRFQRMADARNFSGWVRRVCGRSLVVTTATDAEFAPGEEFRFEAVDSGHLAEFRAKLVLSGMAVVRKHGYLGPDGMGDSATALELEVSGGLKYIGTAESVRLAVEGVTAWVSKGTIRELVQVVDIAPKGAGIQCGIAWERGASLRVEVGTVFGRVQADGRVCYCRRMRDGTARNRVGLALSGFSRVDQAKWLRLFDLPR